MAFNDLPISDLDALVPAAVRQARKDLAPARDLGAIIEALTSLASVKGVEMPTGPAFEISLEKMASWPPDLFIKAFGQVIETHTYPRLPYVGEFYSFIAADLAARRARLADLEDLQRKIERRDRDECLRREAEWMARGRQKPTQAELDAVAAMMRQVRGHLSDPASLSAGNQSEQGDPRSDRDVQAEADRQAR